jgi:hypothetical protein
VTPQPGAGEGSYVLIPSSVTSGACNTSLEVDFTAGATAFTTGLITIEFPASFDVPTSANFALLSSQASVYGAVQSYSGSTYTAQVSGVGPGQTLRFLYGYNTCVAIGPASPAVFFVNSSPQSTDPTTLLPLAGQQEVSVLAPTGTPTVTLTSTPTPSFTVTPTISPTFTSSPTFTITPTPGVEGRPYSFPNPFDLKQAGFVTFLYPAQKGVHIEIFNLAGEPVVKDLDAGSGNPTPDLLGNRVAWDGRDDHGVLVSGGLYFYRIKGDSKTWTGKLTIVH